MKVKIFFIVSILLIFTSTIAISVGVIQLPDTGQTKCYSGDYPFDEIPCAGTGQDGDYNINPMSFTDNGNGTVTDNNTGLMWQKEDDGNSYKWDKASGTYDKVYNPTSLDVCGSLVLGSYSDWRLPAKKELMSIVDYSIPYPGPTIYTTYFPNTKSSHYWSSSTDANLPHYAWFVDFSNGDVNRAGKHNGDYYVRCVRGGQYPEQNLIDNKDGTVTDNATGLVWQETSPAYLTWGSALSYCNGLSLGDKTDWRLPNIKEIESITDDTLYNPAIDSSFFLSPSASHYWSSTTRGSSHYAWAVHFGDGSVVSYYGKGGNLSHVRCVRGGQVGGTSGDSDNDGLPDAWELQYFSDLVQNPDDDYDHDNLNNLKEYQYGTDPTKWDTDGDGMNDGEEFTRGTDPAKPSQTVEEKVAPLLPIAEDITMPSGTLKPYPEGVTFNSDKPTVVITHGCDSDTDSWATDMAKEIKVRYDGVNIYMWDWREKAKSHIIHDYSGKGKICPFDNTKKSGEDLAQALIESLDSVITPPLQYSGKIHFIGHSLGALVISSAAQYLHDRQKYFNNLDQLSMLDAAPTVVIASYLEALNKLKEIKGDRFIDNYMSLVGAGNLFIVDSANANIILFTSLGNPLGSHSYAHQWYYSSICNFNECSNLGDDISPGTTIMPYGFYWSAVAGGDRNSASSLYCSVLGAPQWSLITPAEVAQTVKGKVEYFIGVAEKWSQEQIDAFNNKMESFSVKVKVVAINTFNTASEKIGYYSDKANHAFWELEQDGAGYIKMLINSDVVVHTESDMPADVNSMRFSFEVVSADSGSMFEVFVEDVRVYSIQLDEHIGQGFIDSDWMDVSAFAGKYVKLSFRLSNPVEGNKAVINLDDIIFANITPLNDFDNDGYPSDVDCNDNNPAVNPGVTEGPSGNATCSDGIDNDCDGYTDLNDSGCKLPDLTVTSVAFTPIKIIRSNSITVTATTKNKGKGTAGESTTQYYLSKDNLKSKKDILLTDSSSVQALDAATSSPKTTTVTIPANTRPGYYYIIACADDTKQVTESKEGNNCRASGKMIRVKK